MDKAEMCWGLYRAQKEIDKEEYDPTGLMQQCVNEVEVIWPIMMEDSF